MRLLFRHGSNGTSRGEIKDRADNALMIVESRRSAINWMEPRELEWDQMSFRVNDAAQPSISSGHHVGGYPGPHVAAFGGRKQAEDSAVVGYVDESMSEATIKALLTIDGGEKTTHRLGPERD